jgi:quinol monooxygenase YgiN
MPTIAESTGLVTIINVFVVEPSNQQKLLDILARATETAVRDMPGFVSAALHRSLDGTRVTMYGQWESEEHYRHYIATRSTPGTSPYVDQALAIARFDPGTYEVTKVVVGPSKPLR